MFLCSYVCVCVSYPARGEPGHDEERLVDEGAEDVHEGPRRSQVERLKQGLSPEYYVVEDHGRQNGDQCEQPHPACREPYIHTRYRTTVCYSRWHNLFIDFLKSGLIVYSSFVMFFCLPLHQAIYISIDLYIYLSLLFKEHTSENYL